MEGIDSGADLPPVIIKGPSNGSASVSGKDILYTPNTNFTGRDTVTYIVCDTDILVGCDTDHLFITVNPAPVANAGPNFNICYGDTITMGNPGVAGNTYMWSPAAGLSSTTVAQPKASPDDTTTYSMTVTNTSTGCSATNTVEIVVRPVPTAFIIEGDTIDFCKGQPMTLTSSNGARFLWSNGDTTKTITIDSAGKYSVIVTYANGCRDNSLPSLVIINPLPVANGGPDPTICSGDSVLIGTGGSANNTYVWAPATGLSSDSTAQTYAKPTATISYTLTVTDTITGCQNSDTITVTVLPAPVANAGPNDTICRVDPVTIGTPAVAGITYSWAPAAGLSSTTVAQPQAGPSATTTYTLTASNGSCSSTDSVIVVVRPRPVANAGDDTTICAGDSANLGAPPAPGTSYSWSPNTGLSSSTVSQPKASPSVTTTYTLTSTIDSTGCLNTHTVTVTVLPAPVANAGPNKSDCFGDSVSIGTPATAGVNYSWSPITGLSSSTVAQPNASPAITTTYTLTASNSCGSSTNTVVITINPNPAANAGPNKTICAGDSTTIGTAAVAGMTYSWAPTTGLSSSTVAQPNASPAGTTTYTLTVSNGTCDSTSSVLVTVNPQPVANAGPNKSICAGDSTTIGTPTVAGTTYSWLPTTGLSSSTVAQPNASPAATTNYTLTVSNGCGNATNTVTITVNPQPVANTGPNKSICAGDSTTIGTAAVAGVTYNWSPATGLSSSTVAQPNASPAISTTYTLTASNGACDSTGTVTVTVNQQPVANAGPNKSICAGDSTLIGTPAVAGMTYSWLPVIGLSSNTEAQPNASPAATITYTLTVTNGGCDSTNTVTVTVNPKPIANAGPDQSMCLKDSTTIGTPGIAGTTYSWVPSAGLSSITAAQPEASPAATTSYTLTASNGDCSTTDTVVVTVLPEPANAGGPVSICKGDSVTIGTAAVAGTIYNWMPSAGLSSTTVAQPKASPAVTRTYTLVASNGTCSNRDSVTVTVVPKPVAVAGPDKVICRGDSTSLGTQAIVGMIYRWSPSSGLNSPYTAEPQASPKSTTVYMLTVGNDVCSDSDTVTVKVNPLPIANAGSGQTTCAGSSIVLGSTAVAGDTYVWSPSTGLSSTTSAQPTANPTATTVYTLVVTDTATHCSNTAEVQVSETGGGNGGNGTQVCNAISPNGDGVNDWWYVPVLDCYPTNSVSIVNRWGSEVWTANNYNNTTVRWDGKSMNGTELPDGTYYYTITYGDTEQRGWILIKR